MNLSHLVLALFITFHKTLFAFVLFSGRHCVVIRSGISRVFPATMQKAAPGSSGAACRAYFSGRAHFSGSVLLVKTALAVKAGLGHRLCGVLELGGVVVHVQLAGDHAVVHLAAFVEIGRAHV